MADIKNYTLNFGFGRPALPALTCASRRSAFAEVERSPLTASGRAYG
ncbi:MAG: hypothetical protein KF786_08370 [Burkholderiaceae bacterium]|jgi:hypothetical protein|nr:hypothetical protein [Burkholderiaceae bacterium]MBX3613567.1 hypothetical protein [Burkholderiaceae bacterium]HMN63593.1 hypothetical protein [Burkholderiaceae bacterium]